MSEEWRLEIVEATTRDWVADRSRIASWCEALILDEASRAWSEARWERCISCRTWEVAAWCCAERRNVKAIREVITLPKPAGNRESSINWSRVGWRRDGGGGRVGHTAIRELASVRVELGEWRLGAWRVVTMGELLEVEGHGECRRGEERQLEDD